MWLHCIAQLEEEIACKNLFPLVCSVDQTVSSTRLKISAEIIVNSTQAFVVLKWYSEVHV